MISNIELPLDTLDRSLGVRSNIVVVRVYGSGRTVDEPLGGQVYGENSANVEKGLVQLTGAEEDGLEGFGLLATRRQTGHQDDSVVIGAADVWLDAHLRGDVPEKNNP